MHNSDVSPKISYIDKLEHYNLYPQPLKLPNDGHSININLDSWYIGNRRTDAISEYLNGVKNNKQF